MKKIIPVFLCAFLVISCSACSNKADAVDLNRLYSVSAEISIDDFTTSAVLSRLGNGAWDLSFTAPENINGLTVTYLNETAEISYKGLSFSIPNEEIPASAIAEALTKSLDNAAFSAEVEFTEKNGKIKAKGKISDNEYELSIDKKSGAVLSLEIPDINFEADFSDFSLMG
ncbi:MAG: hypothetical protein WC900_00280 [Oscillospiraceae bacterium]|jgi:hypothetical protein